MYDDPVQKFMLLQQVMILYSRSHGGKIKRDKHKTVRLFPTRIVKLHQTEGSSPQISYK